MNRYVPHSLLNWSLNPKFTSHNELGFRIGFEGRKETVYFIGGSATYCHFIEDRRDTFPYLVGKKTGFRTINGGVSGYTFLQSMTRFLMWRKFYDPKIVIVYDGKNDIVPLLVGKSQVDYSPNMRRFKNSFIRTSIYDIVYGKRNWDNIKDVSYMQDTLLSYYTYFNHICKAEGIRVIFIPQITRTVHYHLYLNALKNHLQSIGETMIFEDYECFFDNTHFSIDGSKKFAKKICDIL